MNTCKTIYFSLTSMATATAGRTRIYTSIKSAYRRFITLTMATALAASLFILPGQPSARAAVAQDGQPITAAPSDFNGDSFADLAVGSPYEDVNGKTDAGAINILYGSPYGLGAKCPTPIKKKKPKPKVPTGPLQPCVFNIPDNQHLHQDTPGVPQSGQNLDHFGETLAYGDFNGDGFSDLAIGIPDEDFNLDRSLGTDGRTYFDLGSVVVIYGSPQGLKPEGDQNTPSSQLLTARTFGEPESFLSDGDRFGAALAAGDFDADGVNDLAITAPGYDNVGVPFTYEKVGRVFVMYGERLSGLSEDGGMRRTAEFTANHALKGYNEPLGVTDYQYFGYSLAAGDFDGDGVGDLAVGVPSHGYDFPELTYRAEAGAVMFLYGKRKGLISSNIGRTCYLDQLRIGRALDQFLTPGFACGGGNRFGHALAAGDFDGDGDDDIAIGVPGASHKDQDVGVVNVVYSMRETGPSIRRNGQSDAEDLHTEAQRLMRGLELIHFTDANDRFGEVLAAGDLNGDGFEDLAVGVPSHDNPGAVDAGTVHLIYGTVEGLDRDEGLQDDIISQETAGMTGENESLDRFGASVAILDFGRSTHKDLAIGVPGESLNDKNEREGAVRVLYGTGERLNGVGHQAWDRSMAQVPGGLQSGARFGYKVE